MIDYPQDGLVETVHERFEQVGFTTRPLAETHIPASRKCPDGDEAPVRYKVFGDPDAPLQIYNTVSYLTDLDDPHLGVRLLGQQLAVGQEGACVIGIQAYEPRLLGPADRNALRTGDFTPLSRRVLRVAEHLQGTSMVAIGNSLGGDTSVQVGHDVAFNHNRGVANVVGVGGIEIARVVQRGGMAAVNAFNRSSGELYTNVQASNTVALTEAWKLRGGRMDAPLFQARIAIGAAGYMVAGTRRHPMAGVQNNRAIITGLETDESRLQARRLLAQTRMPVFLGVETGSTVFTTAVAECIAQAANHDNQVMLDVGGGDHSSDDHILRSASRMLRFARFVTGYSAATAN